MNPFDFQIIKFINQFSQHSWLFDTIMVNIFNNNLLKGGVLITIIWWSWFSNAKNESYNRNHIVATLLVSFIAILIGRALELGLPFRVRPIIDETLQFKIPIGMSYSGLEKISSFPSDHAILFITLSTGIFFVSRKVGLFLLCYTLVFISFPRLYLGLHYPTDILAGIIIGLSISLPGNIFLVKKKFVQAITSWADLKPGLFYSLFFLISYQIADLFETSRSMVSAGLIILRHFAG